MVDFGMSIVGEEVNFVACYFDYHDKGTKGARGVTVHAGFHADLFAS